MSEISKLKIINIVITNQIYDLLLYTLGNNTKSKMSILFIVDTIDNQNGKLSIVIQKWAYEYFKTIRSTWLYSEVDTTMQEKTYRLSA